MADGPHWRTSGWDHAVHAFYAFGEVASEAACKHTALTSNLGEPAGGERICPVCARQHGSQLERLAVPPVDERDRWGGL